MTTTLLGEQMAPEMRPAQNFQAGTDIAKYRVVKYDGANPPDGVVVTAADTDIPKGVTVKEIKRAGGVAGSNVPDYGDIVIKGRTRVVASAAITAGARITCEAAGKVKAAVAGDIVIGHAVDAAAADDDVIMAEIDCVAPVLF